MSNYVDDSNMITYFSPKWITTYFQREHVNGGMLCTVVVLFQGLKHTLVGSRQNVNDECRHRGGGEEGAM